MDAEVFASGRSRGDGEVAWASAVVLLVEGEHARRRQGEYAVHESRPRGLCELFATASRLRPAPHKLIESRPGLEFSAIRRKCSWPESPSANPSNPGILGPEKHHVAFEFAEGRRTEFAGVSATSRRCTYVATVSSKALFHKLATRYSGGRPLQSYQALRQTGTLT
ncbi:uncharacterized protein LOC125552138 isoform X1 [Triticum urartu]|uniref:uncharacterized protein LOC125552138 isoform X1 n=1 Tax=Triticum urartu TaxID=4572 RepID=UPI0020447663|nr:uncharacterized protein LOC125552138 isoform X1 [Triticum urartu]